MFQCPGPVDPQGSTGTENASDLALGTPTGPFHEGTTGGVGICGAQLDTNPCTLGLLAHLLREWDRGGCQGGRIPPNLRRWDRSPRGNKCSSPIKLLWLLHPTGPSTCFLEKAYARSGPPATRARNYSLVPVPRKRPEKDSSQLAQHVEFL